MDRPDVTRLQLLGFEPFPCAADKRPRVRWQEPAPAAGWAWQPDDLIGLPLPVSTVAVDIDDLAAVRDSGLEFILSNSQGTRSGGLHIFYRTLAGRDVPQVVRRGGIGLDTRVGGRPAKGYVIAWEPDIITAPEEWAMAPDWVYEQPKPTPGSGTATAGLGTRTDILSFLGKMAARVKLTESDYLSLLMSARQDGRIVALDPKRPWTDKDLRILASEAAVWEPVEAAPELFKEAFRPAPREEGRTEWSGDGIMAATFAPLYWLVPTLLPEGLAIMAAPPKTGKSVLCYQLAVAVAAGRPLLDLPATPGPVLYYALEDGERRAQDRIRRASGGNGAGLDHLTVRFEAPSLGGMLEKEVDDWLTGVGRGLVIIDVLAKVQSAPKQSNQNAYNADYGSLSLLHHVAKQHPGSTILVVTHDRKAGSEDWMTRVTGTRGVTGVADTVLFINRKRGEPVGLIVATGRDQEDIAIDASFGDAGWQVATPADLMAGKMSTISETRRAILEWLREHGPASPQDVATGTGLNPTTVRNRVRDMVHDDQLADKAGLYFVQDTE